MFATDKVNVFELIELILAPVPIPVPDTGCPVVNPTVDDTVIVDSPACASYSTENYLIKIIIFC